MSLSDKMSISVVQSILEQRRIKRFESVAQLRNVSGLTPQLYESIRGIITVKPQNRYYNVIVTGVSGEFMRKVQIVLKRDSDTVRIEPILRVEL